MHNMHLKEFDLDKKKNFEKLKNVYFSNPKN